MGSENVFNIVQAGAQSGTAYVPGSAVPATLLIPVEGTVAFELDRSSQFSKQDRGRNVRNSASSGFHGIRGAGCTLPAQATFEYLPWFLERHAAGGVAATGSGTYTRVYPFEATTPTIVPATIEGGNTDTSVQQMRLTSALIDQLTLGFPDIVAPGAYPWTISATVLAFDREISALTTSGAGTNEVQHVDIVADGGTFTLSFNGVSTSPIAYNETTGNVQTALRGLSTINGANVNVTGSAGAYVVTFVGSLAATNVPALVGSATGLTGTPHTCTVTTPTPGVPATAVGAYATFEIMQGHLTTLYEGTTSTAFASLSELAGSLKSFTMTTNRNLARRAYGGTSDVAVRYGFKDMSAGTFEAKVAVSSTAKSDFHDVWNTSGGSLGERRWRLKVIGSGSNEVDIDARVGITAVPLDDVDGERVYKVTGEFVDDSTLGAPVAWTVVNTIASL